MKRLICLLSCFCLFLTLTACVQNTPYVTAPAPSASNITTLPQTQPTTVPAVPETTYPLQEYPYPMAAVSLPVLENIRYAEDGKPIFTYSFQTMSLVIPEPSAGTGIMVDYLNRTDFSGSAAETVDQAAQAAYSGQSDWAEYFYQNFYTPTRLDQSILSLYGTKTYYDGAPHTTLVAEGLTYDLMHGTVLTLRQLLVPNYDSAVLTQLIAAHFDPEQTEFFYPGYTDIILDMFSTNIPVEDWYLTDDGLCFFFNPGEIAPYSEEIPVSTIPYEELNGLLQDAYFPAESANYYGAPVLNALEPTQIPEFDHIAELIVKNDDPRYCLSSNGTILDLRVTLGSWDESWNFTEQATVFAAQALTDGTAVLLQCPEDWISRLCITYQSGEDVYSIPASILLS